MAVMNSGNTGLGASARPASPPAATAPAAPYEHALIDGLWTSGAATSTFEVVDPAISASIPTLPRLTAADASRAVDGAHRAYAGWRRAGPFERSKVLRRWAEIIGNNRERLAAIITAEQGKPLHESYAEIDYAVSFVEWFAGEAPRVYGETLPGHSPSTRITVLREPLGVGVAITPWNLPAAMVTRTVAPALATGNTIVLKPAEQTPLTALALWDFALQAGLPPGVLQVIVGSAEDAPALGTAMIEHPASRNSDMLVAQEETFGPVAAIQPFGSEADVIQAANATLSGLAAYFFTQDVNRAWRVTDALEYGIVGHNTAGASTASAPFGGMKESGIGRAGSHFAAEEWTEIKYVCPEVG